MAPSNISAGNLTVGIVVDSQASDEQGETLGRIFKGDEGGMFGESFEASYAEAAEFEYS